MVVLTDDVAASGSTLLHALRPVLDGRPASIKIAVLVDRQHKAFPLVPDIVGHTLATTLQENIMVEVADGHAVAAYLE
jgi:pyrimidine operon attenuation protein/uracil phosphoribosyltransferase